VEDGEGRSEWRLCLCFLIERERDLGGMEI
jgi:hypothetical protein